MNYKNKKFRVVFSILIALIVVVIIIGVTGKEKVDENESSEPKTPKESVESVITDVFGSENTFYEGESSIESIEYNDGNKHVDVSVFSSSNLSKKSIKESALYNIKDSLEKIHDNEDIESINFEILYPLQNDYGEESDKPITKASFTNETLDKIVWDNFSATKIPEIADEYWYHETLDK